MSGNPAHSYLFTFSYQNVPGALDLLDVYKTFGHQVTPEDIGQVMLDFMAAHPAAFNVQISYAYEFEPVTARPGPYGYLLMGWRGSGYDRQSFGEYRSWPTLLAQAELEEWKHQNNVTAMQCIMSVAIAGRQVGHLRVM